MKKLYVLQGDIVDFDYGNFGVFDSKEKLLDSANELIKDNLDLIKQFQDEFDFSGLVFSEAELNNQVTMREPNIKMSLILDAKTNKLHF